MSRVPREWVKLQFFDPRLILVGLRKAAREIPLQDMEYQVASLRSRGLRKYHEGRQAALFCYGMSHVLGVNVSFALSESKDHDIIARYQLKESMHYVPVQLKEFVPEFVRKKASLQLELDKLNKYVDAKDLVVAFHLNREESVNISQLKLPIGTLGELWFYGASDLSQDNWVLIGNLLSQNSQPLSFSYPEA